MEKYDLEIIIGLDCNNNCIFCSNQALRGLCTKKRASTSFEYIKKILESEKDKSTGRLYFVGGEPTIIKDFIKIIRLARKLGYSDVFMETNGRLLCYPSFAKSICEENINVGISIHGGSQEIHDRLTRSKGSFRQLIRGMNNLTSNNKRFTTNTVINRVNYKMLPNIVEFLSHYNPDLILFSLMSPVGVPKKRLNKILPPLSKLSPIIKESIIKARKLNQNIRFADFPVCMINGYENYMFERENRRERKIIARGIKDFFYIENKNKNEKIKLRVCINCKRERECNGIWKGYKAILKNNTLKPIRNL